MNPSAPVANLLVIRSPDIHRAVQFYQCIGMTFELHSRGNGPQHYASDLGGFVFEIYPQRKADDSTARTRIGFNVTDVDSVIDQLKELDATITSPPDDTEWGRQRLGERINIDSFRHEPSVNSSLKFLRKTDWARAKVERLYLYSISYDERHGKNNADADEGTSETGSVWDRAPRD